MSKPNALSLRNTKLLKISKPFWISEFCHFEHLGQSYQMTFTINATCQGHDFPHPCRLSADWCQIPWTMLLIAHTEMKEKWGSFDRTGCCWATLYLWFGLMGIFKKRGVPDSGEYITVQRLSLLCLSHSAVFSSEPVARVSKGRLNPAKG